MTAISCSVSAPISSTCAEAPAHVLAAPAGTLRLSVMWQPGRVAGAECFFLASVLLFLGAGVSLCCLGTSTWKTPLPQFSLVVFKWVRHSVGFPSGAVALLTWTQAGTPNLVRACVFTLGPLFPSSSWFPALGCRSSLVAGQFWFL